MRNLTFKIITETSNVFTLAPGKDPRPKIITAGKTDITHKKFTP